LGNEELEVAGDQANKMSLISQYFGLRDNGNFQRDLDNIKKAFDLIPEL
jgi:hypothetical protein